MLPPVIYHYTSISAFKSIIRNKQFWLTHHQHVNDTKEVVTGLEILAEESLDYLSRCCDAVKTVKFSEDIFDQYFLCFCGRVNNDHLWEHYSGMGGLALGFSTKALMKYSPVSIFPVSYDIDQYRALCRERIGSLKPVSQEDEEKLKEYIRKTRDLEGARKLLQEIPNYQQYRDTTSYLSAYATLLKGPKWKKEEEVRLCHWPITCTERNIPLLDTSMGANKPRAILQLDEVPLVSISTMDDKRTLQQKGFFNFLSKHNLNYLN